MSVNSRLRYHYRSLIRAWALWRVPTSIDTMKVRALLIISVLFIGCGFIMKTSELSTTGYHIHDLEKQVASLEGDAERLQMEIATLQSMPNINRRLQSMNMVQPEAVTYLTNGSVVVAKK